MSFELVTDEVVLKSSLSRPIRAMASRSSVMRTAVVVMAVVLSVAALANAQISPAPAPDSGAFSLVPSMVAPVLGMVVAFFASRVLC